MLSSHRIVARLALFAAPLLLAGAHADCGGPQVCAAIALECPAGEVPADTDDDGCEDSCVPEATCLALPVCEPGELQIDGPEDCLQDTGCYENTVCGSTIWCTGEAAASCMDSSECGDGEYCDLVNYCDAPPGGGGANDAAAPAVCYGRCIEEALCDAYPACDEGDSEVAGPSDCLQDDANCYERSMCGSTIWCTGPA